MPGATACRRSWRWRGAGASATRRSARRCKKLESDGRRGDSPRLRRVYVSRSEDVLVLASPTTPARSPRSCCIDLIRARMPLEMQSVAYAVRNATPEDILEMRRLLATAEQNLDERRRAEQGEHGASTVTSRSRRRTRCSRSCSTCSQELFTERAAPDPRHLRFARARPRRARGDSRGDRGARRKARREAHDGSTCEGVEAAMRTLGPGAPPGSLTRGPGRIDVRGAVRCAVVTGCRRVGCGVGCRTRPSLAVPARRRSRDTDSAARRSPCRRRGPSRFGVRRRQSARSSTATT